MGTGTLLEAVVQTLARRRLTLAVAESFTAGCAAHRIIDEPDAGDVVVGGVVAYAERVKRELLGVTAPRLISDECAIQMAQGVQQLLGTSSALGFTGVAGPATQEGQPVGTVHIAASFGASTLAASFHLAGSPNEIRDHAVDRALQLLAELLAGASEGARQV